MPRQTLRARYVFPVDGEPIADGCVTIDGRLIVAVEAASPSRLATSQPVVDLGNVAILPGLINAHTHLDFSDLAQPLGQPGIGFVDWIRSVMSYRRANAEQTSSVADRVSLGLRESIRHGVTTLADIAQTGWPYDRIGDDPLDVFAFQELIAPTVDRIAAALELAHSHLATKRRVSLGLSPHASYSVHPTLLAEVVALSAAKHVRVAMHLAESQEEIEWMQHGTGPFRAFFEELGVSTAQLDAYPMSRPMNYLQTLASADRALIVHGNYLDDEAIAFLGERNNRMAAVYCPRTHAWFGHRKYPLPQMLAAGVTVALGTDGRGSSPDLSMLAEMRTAAAQHPEIALRQILQMGTISGARALGHDAEIGSLAPGKSADLTIVSLRDHDAADPHELLLRSETPVVGRYFRGE